MKQVTNWMAAVALCGLVNFALSATAAEPRTGWTTATLVHYSNIQPGAAAPIESAPIEAAPIPQAAVGPVHPGPVQSDQPCQHCQGGAPILAPHYFGGACGCNSCGVSYCPNTCGASCYSNTCGCSKSWPMLRFGGRSSNCCSCWNSCGCGWTSSYAGHEHIAPSEPTIIPGGPVPGPHAQIQHLQVPADATPGTPTLAIPRGELPLP
jgi:hypothetical protein